MVGRQQIVIFASLLGGLALTYLLYLIRGHDTLPDFMVFYQAGERWLDGEMLYRSSDGHWQFKYFPSAALYFAPYALVPLGLAKYLWMVTVVAALGGMMILSRRLLNWTSERWTILVLPTLLIMIKYYLRELDLGQANAIISFLLVASIVMSSAGRALAAGILIGVAASIKPYALIFFPYLVVKREFTTLGAALATMTGVLLLSLSRYGLADGVELVEGWVGLVSRSTAPLLTNPDNISLFGFYAKWIGRESPTLVFSLGLITATLIGVAFLISMRRQVTADADMAGSIRAIEGAILLTLIPLLSPQGWDHAFLSGTLGIMILISFRRQLTRFWWWLLVINLGVIGLSLYDLMGRQWYRAFMDASLLTICFLVLIGYLIWLRMKLVRTV